MSQQLIYIFSGAETPKISKAFLIVVLGILIFENLDLDEKNHQGYNFVPDNEAVGIAKLCCLRHSYTASFI